MPIVPRYARLEVVYLDIETIPSMPSPAWLAAQVPPNIARHPEKVSVWLTSEPAMQAVRKRALDPLTAHVVSVASALGDADVVQVGPYRQSADTNEREVLEAFAEWLFRQPKHRLCGWNIVGFDAPVLGVRAASLGLPKLARKFRVDNRWNPSTMLDLMLQWPATSYNGRPTSHRNLAAVSEFWHLPGEHAYNGSMVFDSWLTGDIEAIATHNTSDVRVLRTIHNHMVTAGLL